MTQTTWEQIYPDAECSAGAAPSQRNSA